MGEGDLGIGSLAGRRWVFGRAVLDERSLELLVDGEPVELERKPLEVLLYLLHHAGEAVTKDELGENLWPGRILTETVLTRCISVLRQALKDDDRAVIRTVHGFGYRLVADIKVEAAPTTCAPRFDFRPGDSPPRRPQWKLLERLGTGGHGEAWLARHEKTHDARVFKFALDEGALVSLKREITLYRLLHDSLGANAAIARILEWNLEEAPYFIEIEYVEGRDLRAWADAQGGLLQVPLESRLELAAQIADALAAAHSVGVLHKDLKPTNVLVELGSKPKIKLCDFGSGGVLDASRLEALGITRLGFTKSLAATDARGTALYVSPEVIKGQPSTVRADVYALGVLLYQLVVGDLQKPLAPGWEFDVEDELLREDIALAAAGNPSRRLADAAELSERLRTLQARREARAAELAARQRAERAQRAVEELRRTRAYAAGLLVLTLAAAIGGITAYRARNEAVAATTTAKAVSDFLMDDVLLVDPAIERPKDASFESLLNRASAQVNSRFRNQPEAAANVHWLLGRRYLEIGNIARTITEFEAALTLYRNFRSRPDQYLLVLHRLAPLYLEIGKTSEALTIAYEFLGQWTMRHGSADLSTLLVRQWSAKLTGFAGNPSGAAEELRAVLRDIPHAKPPSEGTKVRLRQLFSITRTTDIFAVVPDASIGEILSAFTKNTLGGVLRGAEDYPESEANLRDCLAVLYRILGEDNELAMMARMSLGSTLAAFGKYEEAERLIVTSRNFYDSWLPPTHINRAIVELDVARLRLEQRRPTEAVVVLSKALEACANACPLRVIEDLRYDLGRAYEQLGRLPDAILIFGQTLAAYEKVRGADYIGSIKRRVSLADVFRRAGRMAEARTTIAVLNKQALPEHPTLAELLRVEGLLSQQAGEQKAASAALKESLRILDLRLGPIHWRTQRVRAELAQAQKTLH